MGERGIIAGGTHPAHHSVTGQKWLSSVRHLLQLDRLFLAHEEGPANQ